MKPKKYLIVSFLALLAAGCQDDDMGGGTAAQPGDEVTFSVSLGENTATRTVYGNYDEHTSSYPINWVSGDQVIIASPDCDTNGGGNPMAKYNVTPVDGNATTGTLSLADDEDKGVQWSTTSPATFYSVYPVEHTTYRATFGTNYSTVTLVMPRNQTVRPDNSVSYDMEQACFMYAKTIANSGTVGLTYVPISTALRFTLQGPTSSSSAYVSQITVTAPTGTYIAGTFTTDLAEAFVTENQTSVTAPKLTASGSNYNDIRITPYQGNANRVTLSTGDTYEVNVFFLLENDVASAEDWTITLSTNLGSYTKSLSGVALTSGKIHNLGMLPALD